MREIPNKPLEVKFGSIYTTHGTMIDHMAIIVSTAEYGCVSKYGSQDSMQELYVKRVNQYREMDMQEEADGLILLEFDRYEGELTMDEVCVLCNYLILASPKGSKIKNILDLDVTGLRLLIKDLISFGY